MLASTKISSPFTQICSSFTANSTSFSGFVFNAKEKDYESGFHYYGSRYYSSELSIWNSTDPMADKYPSLTPYNYCANNPVKLIDPNGEDFDPIVDEENKTITITASYYTTLENKKELQGCLNFWNSQSGKYSYVVKEGDKRQEYKINFNLTIADGDFYDYKDAYNAMLGSGSTNSNIFIGYIENLKNKDGNKPRGMTTNGNIISLSSTIKNYDTERTLCHEIGHTLGISDWGIGLMESGGRGKSISKQYIQESLHRAGITNDKYPFSLIQNPSYNEDFEKIWKTKHFSNPNIRIGGKVK